jgi:cell division protease FtsH
MDDHNETNSKPNEKKPQQHSNIVWYLLGFGILVLLFVTFWSGGSEEDVQWSDLLALIEATGSQHRGPADQGDSQDTGEVTQSAAAAPGDTPEAAKVKDNVGYVFVETGSESRPREIRLSNLEKVKIGASEVTARVAREVVKSKSVVDGEVTPVLGDPEKNVKLRVARDPNEQELAKFLTAHNVTFGYADGPSALLSYLPVLVLTVLFVLLFIMMIRRMGGAGSPMAFGRSRGKLYAQEDIDITFGDVAGIDEAVDELREVVEFLKTPEKFQLLGGRIPKGVLLIGPPGTGKTLLAKAIAGEAGVPFFSLSGSDFVEMFVGVGAARVRDMFQQAEQRAPCIIFIDELDALGKTRGSGHIGGHDEREQTLNALLVEMDGFGTNSGVIVMAATNRPETLDPALLRPGRFDRHVLVDRPDVGGREEILNVHLKEIKVDANVDVKALAAITSGFVGADLANMVNEAALLAARKGKKTVTMHEFNEAVERSAAGLEKKKRIMQHEEKLRVAYHESGHALVAYSLPNTDPVHKVSIIPRGLAALGYTMQRPEQDRFLMTQGELESRIQVLLAGTLAEEMVFDDISSGAQNDLERATEIARGMVMDFGMSRLGRISFRESNRNPFLVGSDGPAYQTHSEQTAREIDEEVTRIISQSLERTREILERRRPALEAVSKALMEKEVIESGELAAIIEETSPGPMIAAGTDIEPKRAPKTHAAPSPAGGACVTPRTYSAAEGESRDADSGHAAASDG